MSDAEREPVTAEPAGTLMDPDDEFEGEVHRGWRPGDHSPAMDIPPGARTVKNLRDRRKIIE